MNASAQVARQKSLDMSAARMRQPPGPLQVDDTGELKQEASDSTRVIGDSIPVGGGDGGKAREHARPTTSSRLTAPKIIPTAGVAQEENLGVPASSNLLRAIPKESSAISRHQVNDQIDNAVAIRMNSNQHGANDNDKGERRPPRVRRKRPGVSFNPSDPSCYWWSAVVSLAFLYNFWSISYRCAFREIDSSTCLVWFTFDYLADFIYLLDIVVMIKTGYLEDGVLQRDTNKIKAHYRDSTLFYLDSSCLLPFDILYLSFGFNSIFRCNRLVKIHKFWSFVDRTERHTNYPNVFRTFTLVHYILVIFHWNACIFNIISDSGTVDVKTLFKMHDDNCNDISCKYLHAFYWSTLALTIIGGLPKPRSQREYIYVIVELFFGLFLFASVLGHVANIVTNVSAARKEFQARLDAVKTFMRTRRVSDDLQRKVIGWFDYLWISQKSSDEERSVACLPDRLKAELAIHVNLDTLKRVDIFQATEAGFLRELVLRLKPVLFSPGDYVCRKDEAGHEMYIVSKGILEVVTNEGQTVVATFRAGSYFGEIAVLNVGLAGNKRTASVRSVGYSDLFCLSKQDLWDVLKDYPNAEARIRAVAEERLTALGERASGPVEDTSRRRGRPSLRRAAAVTSAKQPHQLPSENLRSSDSLNASDDEPGPSGGIDPPPVDQPRRVRNSASTHNRAGQRAIAAGPSCMRAPNSLTMEPICDHAHASLQTRPLRQAPSGYGLMAAGGSCFECQHIAIRRNHHNAHVGLNWCLCQHCHPSSDPVKAPQSPSSDVNQRASLANRRPILNSSSSTTARAINQNAAVTTSGSSSAGGARVGRLQPSSGFVMGDSRHQLSVASCLNRHQRPPSLHIGQSRSFECTPTGGLQDERPARVHRLCQEPDRRRSGRALVARPAETPLASSETAMAGTALDHARQTTTMIERTGGPLRHGCATGSDTTSGSDSSTQGPSLGANLDLSSAGLLEPPSCDYACDLRRSHSLREPRYVRSPVSMDAYSDYDLEGQSEARHSEVEPMRAWHHHQYQHARSSHSMQFEGGLGKVPPGRRQLHRGTCRKQPRPVTTKRQQHRQAIIPILPTGEPRPSSRSNQSAPMNQHASQSAFQAMNPSAELHLAIDVESPGQEAPTGGRTPALDPTTQHEQ